MKLESMSLKQLAALYNEHAPRKAKKFASCKETLRRLQSVLLRPKGPSPRVQQLVALLGKGPRTVAEIAKALGLEGERAARGVIDKARRSGVEIENVARGIFRIGPR